MGQPSDDGPARSSRRKSARGEIRPRTAHLPECVTCSKAASAASRDAIGWTRDTRGRRFTSGPIGNIGNAQRSRQPCWQGVREKMYWSTSNENNAVQRGCLERPSGASVRLPACVAPPRRTPVRLRRCALTGRRTEALSVTDISNRPTRKAAWGQQRSSHVREQLNSKIRA